MTDVVATVSATPSYTPRPAALARGRRAAVSVWLWGLAAMVFTMVFLGGATRLTESGLSITEWNPIAGIIPPLTHAGWIEAFDKYKQIPQYASLPDGMTLGHFQSIFLMEWFHRLVGRLLGVVLIVPFVIFWLRRQLSGRLIGQVLGLFALGGLQGSVGWWMVSSGLSGRVEVAQERLAIHLLLASLTFAALVWIASEQKPAPAGKRMRPASRGARGARALASAVVALVFVQIGFGALVAGLRAGRAYNTWPLMDGHFLPPAGLLGALSPAWRNLVDNLATVQFQHRMTAYLLLAAVLVQAVATARALPGTGDARRAVVLAGLVAVQATIGIVTLLLAVPISAGLLHQLFAMVVLAMAVVHRQRLGAAHADPVPGGMLRHARDDTRQVARA